jgi:hypothetical protein
MAGFRNVLAIQMELIIRFLRNAESRRNRYGHDVLKRWAKRIRSAWRSVKKGKGQ